MLTQTALDYDADDKFLIMQMRTTGSHSMLLLGLFRCWGLEETFHWDVCASRRVMHSSG